jgi:hypothetical protein
MIQKSKRLCLQLLILSSRFIACPLEMNEWYKIPSQFALSSSSGRLSLLSHPQIMDEIGQLVTSPECNA